jgi:hypothetical protein
MESLTIHMTKTVKPYKARNGEILVRLPFSRMSPDEISDLDLRDLDAGSAVIIFDDHDVSYAGAVKNVTQNMIIVVLDEDTEDDAGNDHPAGEPADRASAPPAAPDEDAGDDPSDARPSPFVRVKTWLGDLGDKLYDALPDSIRSVYWWLHRNVSNGRSAVKHAGQRAIRGYDDLTLWNLGGSELERLANLLHVFAMHTHGYPAAYIEDDSDLGIRNGRKHWLNKHLEDNAEWLRSSALGVPSHLYDDKRKLSEHDLNMTVKEYSPAAAAWSQDLEYASIVIREYLRVNNDVDHIMDRDDKLGTRNHYDKVEKEFHRVWTWLGTVMLGIWD